MENLTRNEHDSNPLSSEPAADNRASPPLNLRPVFWQGRIGPAFWTITSLLSLSINLILIVILILVGRELFGLKSLVQTQLVGGLATNFHKMDEASIITSITVSDTINVVDTITVADTIVVQDTMPVVFNLPLDTNTEVRLTEDTQVNGATVFLNGSGVKTDLVLKKGTKLPVHLELTVPVNQEIPVVLNVPINLQVPVNLSVPVKLNVPVNIPLNQTELHEPFVGLQEVVAPYQGLLGGLPDSWKETPVCKPPFGKLCDWLGFTKEAK